MNLGQYNELEILRFTSVGAYLGDTEGNDVLLPNKYLYDELEVGDVGRVFLYKDSEDRLVATTETPKIILEQYAYLKVSEVSLYGAFLDWGLEKDLMVPFKEQNQRMEEGKSYLVTLRIDQATDRLYATMKINKWLQECTDQELINQPQEMLICDQTDLGVKVIVADKYHGMIFRNDISKPIRRGQRLTGYIYNIREDGKVDVRLEPTGFVRYTEAMENIMAKLEVQKVLPLSDSSDPDEIREIMGMSKKTFKQAIGQLYKAGKITIQPNEIRINEQE
ncbi:MAG: S1-like domain-containing RNA-binding protein [Cryomorphaceae bacterium]|jgi:predicted RNA-binding protein (virulence factor B family)|nr:S1-like domain-containing RNA-binding protein [Cryomorphaceae bacterium]